METLTQWLPLVVVYLGLVVVCSLIHELWSAWSRDRAKMLRSCVEQMLGRDATMELYAHPAVLACSEGLGKEPSYLTGGTFARAVLDGLRPREEWCRPWTLCELDSAIREVRCLDLRDMLASIRAGVVDIDGIEKGLAAWFLTAVDRAGGWYKRRVQRRLLAIGLIGAALINLDSLHVLGLLGSVGSDVDIAAKTWGWSPAWPNWTEFWTPKGARMLVLAPIMAVVTALPGWCLTALFVSMGATFWFDLIGKVSGVRLAGKKPE